MFRRLKHWWKDNSMLMLSNGIMSIFPAFLKLQEIGASPQKRVKIEEFRRQFYGMRQEIGKLNKELDKVDKESPKDQSIQIFTVLEKFQQEHVPEGLEETRRWKQDAIARKGERDTIDAIRGKAGENTTLLISDLREFVAEYPQSELAEAALIGALIKGKEYDEALTLAEERLHKKEQNDIAGIGVFGASTTIATILTEKGEPREAIFFLEKLLAERPEVDSISRVGVYVVLADAYEKSNNREAARAMWKRVASYGEYKELVKQAKENLKRLS